ncbi:MAG: hypothetical protein L3J34_05140 [Flavobacteriaceae bacterium]|nr:hypothetical protein [Flavobacteriaceae bacterium]
MELAKIEFLLEKYLDAKTTLEEEQILKTYFSKNDVPEHLLAYKNLFDYFTANVFETSNKEIRLPKQGKIKKWLSVAAAVVLFVSVSTFYQYDVGQKEEAKLAYQETQKALNLIAQNLNKGGDAIAHLQTFDETKNKIFNNKPENK